MNQDTLEQAKLWIREHFHEGVDCPCCGQKVKLYKRKLNSSMAYVLILLYKWWEKNGEAGVHVPSHLNDLELPPGVAAAIRGDWAKLRHWGLIESAIPQLSANGHWRITEMGRYFVTGECMAKKYIYIFNKRVIVPENQDLEMITIEQALGDRFDLPELMQQCEPVFDGKQGVLL